MVENSSRPKGADARGKRRHLYEKAKRAKADGSGRVIAADDAMATAAAVITKKATTTSPRSPLSLPSRSRRKTKKNSSSNNMARRDPDNSKRLPLLAEGRVDDDDDEVSNASSLEAESTFSHPPTPKVYLPKTLGSLSSVLTNESSDFDESTLPSIATHDDPAFLRSLSPTSSAMTSPTSTMNSTANRGGTFTSGGTMTSRSQTLSPMSSYGSKTFQTHLNMKPAADVRRPSPKHRQKLNQWYQKRFPVILASSKSTNNSQHRSMDDSQSHTLGDTTMEETATYMSYCSDDDEEDATTTTHYRYYYDNNNSKSGDDGDLLAGDDGDYLHTKQNVAYLSIGITGIQLFILMMQLAMCGMANVETNALVGPFPDAFSEFGGKNTYMMITKQQWWRLVTPSFLHVGVLHLLANAFCQLEAIALFEREWGSFRWLLVYLISSVGCSGMASIFDPDTIAVGSSGALMGLYAAKLAQVTTGIFFTVSKTHMNNAIRLDQLSSVLCGLTLVSMLSCFTYIDWSGHFGGLVSGFLSGMVLFSYPIKSCCSWFFWSLFGLAGLVATLGAVFYYLMLTYEPFDELGDVCEYFRSLFPENYECGCMNM